MTANEFASSALLLTGAFLVYSYLNARFRLAFQPMRMKLAHDGEVLVADETLPHKLRTNITFLLDESFSSRAAWAIVILIVPAIISALFSRNKIEYKQFSGIEKAKVEKIRRVYMLGLMCIMSNSLFATFWLLFLFLIAIALMIPVTSFFDIFIRSFAGHRHNNGNGGPAHSLSH